MVEYVIKPETRRYYFFPVYDLWGGERFLALGEGNELQRLIYAWPVRNGLIYSVVVEIFRVAASVDLPLRRVRLDNFQTGKLKA